MTGDRLLLRVPEAAERLGVSPRQVRRLIAERGLPAVNIGREYRIPVAGLEAWVAAQTSGSSERHPGEAHEPEPRPYLIGSRAYVARVCRLCGLVLDDGRSSRAG